MSIDRLTTATFHTARGEIAVAVDLSLLDEPKSGTNTDTDMPRPAMGALLKIHQRWFDDLTPDNKLKLQQRADPNYKPLKPYEGTRRRRGRRM